MNFIYLCQETNLLPSYCLTSWQHLIPLIMKIFSKFNLRKLQCIQNSADRIVSNTSRYASIIPVLKKLHWLHVEHRLIFKTAILVSLHWFSPSILLHISLPTAVLTIPGTDRVGVISLWFQSSYPLSINQSSGLAIVLLLMPPLFGMLFLVRFVHPPP